MSFIETYYGILQILIRIKKCVNKLNVQVYAVVSIKYIRVLNDIDQMYPCIQNIYLCNLLFPKYLL